VKMIDSMDTLAQGEVDCRSSFEKNSANLRTIVHNATALVTAMEFFNETLQTMVEKTVEDTLLTIRNLEYARLEYDAHRNELARLQATSVGYHGADIRVAEEKCDTNKQKYERLADDVKVKLQFLAENRTKVMQKQLLLLHNAMCAYHSGNAAELSATLQQFNVRQQPRATVSNTDTRIMGVMDEQQMSHNNDSKELTTFQSFLERD